MTHTLSGFSALPTHFRKLAIFAAAAVMLVVASAARAQSSSPDELTIQPTAADRGAALAAKVGAHHALPANNAAGQALRARQIADRRPMNNASGDGHPGGTILQYAGDLTSLGGQVLTSAVSHAIYLQRQTGSQCTIATCWGDPEGFLRDLGNSDFIHVIDQYVGLHDANRYTVGFHATVQYAAQATPLLDSDIVAFVHAVAAKAGASGHGHIYHVFLPPGQDECFDPTYGYGSGYCYSPDNLATFVYCAYHSYADFPDIGRVIYTVQPYMNVPGCRVQPGTLNGELVDSADSVLNHETFEAITDPDLDAWRNESGAYGLSTDEVADECIFLVILDGQYYGDVPTFLIGAHRYAVQLVYSNEQHACSSAASRGNP
jgi:hypothetical protein